MNDLGGKPCILLLLYCVYARKQLFHSLTTLLLYKFYLKKKTLHNCYDCYVKRIVEFRTINWTFNFKLKLTK